VEGFSSMLYVFRVCGVPWVKMGFTSVCPWRRISNGFWSNVHPPACCGHLGWDDLELIALFSGGLCEEAAVKSCLPPSCGEFWPEEMLAPILLTLRYLLPALPLPVRPNAAPDVGRCREHLPCCGAAKHVCFTCGASFARWHLLVQHKEGHRDQKVACTCGLRVLKRNLKRRQKSCRGR